MRKMLFVVLCALNMSACADDRPITFEQLPDKAQALLTTDPPMLPELTSTP